MEAHQTTLTLTKGELRNMDNRPTPKIVQTLPANGWRYRSDAGEIRPLAALVLVERDFKDGEPPEQSVEGFDGTIGGLIEDQLVMCERWLPPHDAIMSEVDALRREVRSRLALANLGFVPSVPGLMSVRD